MSRPCSACADPCRPELDAAIVRGDSLRDIAGRYGTSKSALDRHRAHVTKALVRAREARQDSEAESLYGKVLRLEADARRLQRKAEEQEDVRAALVAVDKLLDCVRLMHEMAPATSALPTGEGLYAVLRAAADRARAEKAARLTEPRPALHVVPADAGEGDA